MLDWTVPCRSSKRHCATGTRMSGARPPRRSLDWLEATRRQKSATRRPGGEHEGGETAAAAGQDNTLATGHRGGKVRGCVNERGRCNLRFARRTTGATNARTEGDTACEREDHRGRGGVKGRVGDAGSVRAPGGAAPLAAG